MAAVTSPTTHHGRFVDLIDGLGILVESLQLPTHTAQVTVEVTKQTATGLAFQLDGRRALLIGGRLGLGGKDGEAIDVAIINVTSTGRRDRDLRRRLAELLALPETHLRGWTDRDVRHALLYVLEATSTALRDSRLVAIEAALGGRTAL